MPEPSIIDERLAEIDRRLRSIQTGLAPSRPAAPTTDDPDGDAAAEAGGDLGEIAAVAQALEEPPLELDDPPRRRPARLRAAPAPETISPGTTPPEIARPAGALAGDEDPAVVLAQLHELSAAHERLLELHRELLSQYAELLEHRAAQAATVAVTAGPFADAGALRAFEHALAQLPQVAGVAVREYQGDDRVLLDVNLAAR